MLEDYKIADMAGVEKKNKVMLSDSTYVNQSSIIKTEYL